MSLLRGLILAIHKKCCPSLHNGSFWARIHTYLYGFAPEFPQILSLNPSLTLIMKRILLVSSIALASTPPSVAQTNTYPFPSSGSVGIGTSNPTRQLSIYSQYSEFVLKSSSVSGGTGGSTLYFGNSVSDDAGWLNYNHASNSLTVRVNSVNRLSINADGNVGIGTASPESSLHLYKQNPVSRTSVQDLIYLSSTHADVGYDGFGTGIVDFRRTYRNGTPHAINRISMIERGHSGNDFGGAITFETKALNSGSAAPVERMRIDYNGNVGIGTADPTIKLSVAGGGGYTGVQIGTEAGGAFLRWSREGRSGDDNKLNIFDQDGGAIIATFQSGGNVGIGTTNPTHKLAVNGTIKAKEVIVETTGWSDYVFADDYALQPLAEVEAHIKANKHLPGIPSAAQVATEGVSVGELQAKLLAKIEELTLHQIAQQKLLETQATTLAAQSRELDSLRAEVRTLRFNNGQ